MVTKREKIEAWRERVQSPAQMEYDKLRYERLKKEEEYKKKKRKELLARAKKATVEKLKEVEEYGAKTLKKASKRISRVDLTKEPKAYKELQKGLAKAFEKKKVSTAEIKKRRAHQLKVMKLRHKQRMAYLVAQQEAVAREQDPRYQEDRARDQFLNEPFEETPREDYDYEYPEEQKVGVGRRILNGFGNFSRGANRLRLKSSRYFERHRESPRSMLAYENKFNRPFGPRGNDKINLMNSEVSNRAPPLQFTTAPRVRMLGNSSPKKMTILGGKNPKKMTVFGKYNTGGTK